MKSIVLDAGEEGGFGVFNRLIVTESMVSEDTYKKHVQNGIFPY